MAKLGFIGTGHMTRAMVNLMAPKGHDILITHRGRATSQMLSGRYENVKAADPQEVVAGSEIVFLCLRPEHAQDGLVDLPFHEGQTLVSIMSGVPLAQLAQMCRPAHRISAILPMELLERGGCPIPIYPECPEVAALFAPENPMIVLPDEAALAACFAATALTSAVAELLDQGAVWLSTHIGAQAAQAYVGGVVPGMLAVHADQDDRFAKLRDSLATPGTLNLSMVEAVRGCGLTEVLPAQLDTLARRAGGTSEY